VDCSQFGDTPLIKAVENNHFSVVTRLISCGAAVNAANVVSSMDLGPCVPSIHLCVSFWTATTNSPAQSRSSSSCGHGRRSASCPCKPECIRQGLCLRTFLACAVFQPLGLPRVMHHALQNGNTPLILAAESGSVAVVKELLRAGAVVDNVNNVTSTGC
jgi:ankyrin repeat protein